MLLYNEEFTGELRLNPITTLDSVEQKLISQLGSALTITHDDTLPVNEAVLRVDSTASGTTVCEKHVQKTLGRK